METTTDIKKLRQRHKDLRQEQSSYRTHWIDLVEYMAPRSGRYLSTDEDNVSSRGEKRGNKIINGVAYDAARTLGAGLQGGLTSPSRPWFSLGLADRDLMRFSPVKAWLDRVRDIILIVLGRSNFYSSIHSCYEELGIFGTTAMMIEEDFRSVIRCRPFTIGEYCLGLDSTYRPNTLYRQFAITASQAEEKFGKEKLPQNIKQALERKKLDQSFEIVHAIEPSAFRDPSKADYRGMSYLSAYFLAGGSNEGDDGLIHMGGYKMLPFIAPRWTTIGVNTYGDSPGMHALGDIRQLQTMEEKKLKALAKEVDPPMNAPSAMESVGGTVVAGGVNYIDIAANGQGFTPAYQVNMNLQNLSIEEARVEQRIKRFFFNDLFMSLINETKRMTATEVAQRYEEKLVMLGAVLERVQSEALDVIIDRVYAIIDSFHGFPPPPKELQGVPVTVEYISTLAQAQRMVGTQGIEQFVGFVGAVAKADPSVLARVDFDKAVEQYGDKLGIPEEIVRSDEDTAKVRQAQQAQQQMQMMAENAQSVANAAKSASETEVNGQNALEALTGQQ